MRLTFPILPTTCLDIGIRFRAANIALLAFPILYNVPRGLENCRRNYRKAQFSEKSIIYWVSEEVSQKILSTIFLFIYLISSNVCCIKQLITKPHCRRNVLLYI